MHVTKECAFSFLQDSKKMEDLKQFYGFIAIYAYMATLIIIIIKAFYDVLIKKEDAVENMLAIIVWSMLIIIIALLWPFVLMVGIATIFDWYRDKKKEKNF